MPRNINPWTSQLLSWHGHDRGGVRVPFQQGTHPLPSRIETNLIRKLRALARRLGERQANEPRWIFLVGGPGNGKSETVEDFLTALDSELSLSGRLVEHLTETFRRRELLKRRVEVLPSDVASGEEIFRQVIGRLIIIQDATATENPQGDAAQGLARDLADLYTSNENPPPLFIVCANRGLLARAINEANRDYGPENEITRLLGEIIRASGLGIEALARDRKACWPLAIDPRVACWPLDLESLLEPNFAGSVPLEQVLAAASDHGQWELSGRCLDCSARESCSLRQNATWLREQPRSKALIHILRRGEVATGQRWNFRGLFSLTAEIIVGQWQDFDGASNPCEWVHDQVTQLADDTNPAAIDAAYKLTRRLYPHALFSRVWLDQVALSIQDKESLTNAQTRSRRLLSLLTASPAGSTKHIRDYLLLEYSTLDPAIATPLKSTHILRSIEDDYSQSTELGNADPRTQNLALVERNLLWFIERAEAEWDRLGRASVIAAKFSQLLRRLATILVKRSVGVALGHHANEEYLDDYSESLRNTRKLNRLTTNLQSLLGDDNFQFDIVETFGQPQAEWITKVRLIGPRAGLRAIPAPTPSDSSPIHDMPCFEISDTDYRIPITFELFLALRLRQAGCASSSLPASVRASIDRIRHRYAGKLCRDTNKFLDQTVTIEIADSAKIVVTDLTRPITLEPLPRF